MTQPQLSQQWGVVQGVWLPQERQVAEKQTQDHQNELSKIH